MVLFLMLYMVVLTFECAYDWYEALLVLRDKRCTKKSHCQTFYDRVLYVKSKMLTF